jgi:hypothetical protein
MLGVVEMTLRVQVAVADFGGMIEVEIVHAAIIHALHSPTTENTEIFFILSGLCPLRG